MCLVVKDDESPDPVNVGGLSPRVAKPTSEQQRFLDLLEIAIPVHLEWNTNVAQTS